MKKVYVISAYGYIVKKANYGSLLQFYALAKVLTELGFDSYWIKYVQKDESLLKSICKKIYKYIFKHKEYKINNMLLNSFMDFIDENLKTTKMTYHTKKQIKNNPPIADYYITGSDQVWGGTLEPNYLTFAKGKKISYAASFGKRTISKDHLDTIKDWLREMDCVSVREASGIDICNEIGVISTQVLDPTLLLKDSDYLQNENCKEACVLVYLLNVNDLSDAKQDFINKISKHYKINYKYIGGVSKIDNYINEKDLLYLSPKDFISHYKNSKCIITNSFHGTVFSIIFHKQFFVFLQKGQFASQNERIVSLLKLLSLENRIVESEHDINPDLYETIDWDNVEQILKNEKAHSINFLKKSLDIE